MKKNHSIDQHTASRSRNHSRGGDAGVGGLLKDRDNVSLTVKRTF
ncbi:DUF1302 domain-containing protein [Pseudohalioglobus lutimaris]|nr:DUF1302 domain-containing protein [Pseudohalioglobus lutimaris]